MNRSNRNRDRRSEYGGTGRLSKTPLQRDYQAGGKDASHWEGLLSKKDQEKKRDQDRH